LVLDRGSDQAKGKEGGGVESQGVKGKGSVAGHRGKEVSDWAQSLKGRGIWALRIKVVRRRAAATVELERAKKALFCFKARKGRSPDNNEKTRDLVDKKQGGVHVLGAEGKNKEAMGGWGCEKRIARTKARDLCDRKRKADLIKKRRLFAIKPGDLKVVRTSIAQGEGDHQAG